MRHHLGLRNINNRGPRIWGIHHFHLHLVNQESEISNLSRNIVSRRARLKYFGLIPLFRNNLPCLHRHLNKRIQRQHRLAFKNYTFPILKQEINCSNLLGKIAVASDVSLKSQGGVRGLGLTPCVNNHLTISSRSFCPPIRQL